MSSAFIFVIAVGVIILPILFGGIFGLVSYVLDGSVNQAKESIENEQKGYSPAITMGHRIKASADKEEQVKEGRLLAAKKAAITPRGANMRIGRLGHSNLRTAGNPASLEEDPWTAAKVAYFHDWDGARLGVPVGGVPQGGAAPAAVAAAPAAATGKIVLVPGKDYPFTEITDSMSPEEKRKARIANSKAKSKAMKAAKAARQAAGGLVAAAPVAVAPAAAVAAPVAPSIPTGIPEPNYIEITDGMSPDDKRKARIHNSKEKSKYNKALKAAGLDPKAVAAGQVDVAAAVAAAPAAAPVAAPAPVAAAPVAPAATPDVSGIPKPDYMEITDDMPPDEKRKARIHNSKEKSKYNKALKAAGIDPKSVK